MTNFSMAVFFEKNSVVFRAYNTENSLSLCRREIRKIGLHPSLW